MDTNKIIDKLGGTNSVAVLCAPITKGAVSQWRKNGIPDGWLKYLKAIRPDVFVEQKAS